MGVSEPSLYIWKTKHEALGPTEQQELPMSVHATEEARERILCEVEVAYPRERVPAVP